MVRIKATRKDAASNGASSKIPILQIVQVLVVSILGLYVAFFFGPLQDTDPASLLVERKAVEVDNTSTGPPVIGYAVSVTGCGSDPLEEGAAVLKHSIHLTSIHGTKGGR